MNAISTEELARLAELRGEVTDYPLDKTGRHFSSGIYWNLTSCHHGDTGEFSNREDGEAIAILWNAWRSGALAPAARVLELEAALRKIDVGDGWAALIARAALNQTGGAT